MLTVLKLGGELLEGADALRTAAHAVARLSGDGPLVVVHGGGRAIDADLEARGRTPRFADGLRVFAARRLCVKMSRRGVLATDLDRAARFAG